MEIKMPFINTKTNIEISKEKEVVIKQKLGKAIELIPGKNEGGLMVSFEDRCSLYFKGESDQPIAFVEVMILGTSTRDAYQKLTEAITTILEEELTIAPGHIYVRFEETEYWGCNGKVN
jgi:phenylpyruvate tautomerase PptA (4-oxalocrotonate tautomerase family)